MRITTISTILALYLLSLLSVNAQEVEITISKESLEASKEQIIKEEKDALKVEVKAINERLDDEEINQSEADKLKEEVAEKHALNIENRIAIIDNRIALLERNEGETIVDIRKNKVVVGVFDDGEFIRFSYKNKKKFDRRTTFRLVVAFGFNNLISEGVSLNDTDIKIGGSRFFELGWAWKTRVFKESNRLRVKYGFSFSWDGLKPTDNRYYIDNGEETVLQEHIQNLDKAKLRIDKLIIPLHFEFGPSKKIEREDYFRYTTRNQLKIGIGGFAGFKIGSRQKLKFKEDGNNMKEKIKASYNTNNFVYGLSGYVGWDCTALYVKYELNPIFKDNSVDQHNISMGLRFDL